MSKDFNEIKIEKFLYNQIKCPKILILKLLRQKKISINNKQISSSIKVFEGQMSKKTIFINYFYKLFSRLNL